MHHFHQCIRNLQYSEDGTPERHDQEIQQNGYGTNHNKRQANAVLHLPFFFFAEIIGKKGTASHAHADEDGGEEGHQGIGASHGCQCVGTEELAHNEGVGDIV